MQQSNSVYVHKTGGVFAIREIKKDTPLFLGDNEEMLWVQKEAFSTQPEQIRKLYDDFAVVRGGRYGCPPSFNRLTVAWYLNEPKSGEEPMSSASARRTTSLQHVTSGRAKSLPSTIQHTVILRQTFRLPLQARPSSLHSARVIATEVGPIRRSEITPDKSPSREAASALHPPNCIRGSRLGWLGGRRQTDRIGLC
jgi:hypothetical protein